MSEIWAALLGVLAGGLLQVCVAKFNEKREARSILVAICTEVEAICALLRVQHYQSDIKDIIDDLRANPGKNTTYVVDLRSDYFKIFDANCAKIGLLGEDEVRKLVRFYTYCRTLIDCVRPDGPFAAGGHDADYVRLFEETYELLDKTLTLGDEVVQLPKTRPRRISR